MELPADQRRLLSVEEAAARAGIARSRLYLLMREGEVDSIRLGRRRLIPLEAIDGFVDRLPRQYLPRAPQT